VEWTELPEDNIEGWAVVITLKKVLLSLSTSWKRIGGSSCMYQLILNLGTKWRWASSFELLSLHTSERTPVSIDENAGWATEPIWTVLKRKISRLCRDSSGLRDGGEFRDRVSDSCRLHRPVNAGLIASFQSSILVSCCSHVKAAIVSTWAVELWRCHETGAECRQLINGAMETEAYYNVQHKWGSHMNEYWYHIYDFKSPVISFVVRL